MARNVENVKIAREALVSHGMLDETRLDTHLGNLNLLTSLAHSNSDLAHG